MNPLEVLQALNRVGAVITDSHVVYTRKNATMDCPSGWFHGDAYINKDGVYPYTRVISRLCEVLAGKFVADNVEVVIGPAIGGVVLSQWVAHHLSGILGLDVFSVFAEKQVTVVGGGLATDEKFVIKRGYDKLVNGKRVLVVEDVLTSGGSVKKVVRAVRECGGLVVGVGALCNRGGVTAQTIWDVPKLETLVSLSLGVWPEEDCPLCKKGVPINTDVGTGREFLALRAGSSASS